MKVLFVCRDKGGNTISTIIRSQYESLRSYVDTSIFVISGKGYLGYLRGIYRLKKYLKNNEVDIVHAHYSLSAYVAGIASKKPTICSLMGSDVEASKINRLIIRVFSNYFWKAVIVKSKRMKQKIRIENAHILPNGVDLEIFKPLPQNIAMTQVGFKEEVKHIVFIADPSRAEKNYALAKDAVESLKGEVAMQLHPIFDQPTSMIPYYLNAADLLLLTSKWEGSPNVIKEAMACNCPIISVDVGDVRSIISSSSNCYISASEKNAISKLILKVLLTGKRSNGRTNINDFDSNSIAKRLVSIYESVL